MTDATQDRAATPGAVITAELRGPRWALGLAVWLGVYAVPVKKELHYEDD